MLTNAFVDIHMYTTELNYVKLKYRIEKITNFHFMISR